MGYNTVAFILNDYVDDLQKAPKTTADLLAHAVVYREGDVARYAQQNDEPIPHSQAIEVESFHADETRYYRAGQNSLLTLKYVTTKKVDGKKCVVLELPEFMQNDDHY